jgi:hypothetical protein
MVQTLDQTTAKDQLCRVGSRHQGGKRPRCKTLGLLFATEHSCLLMIPFAQRLAWETGQRSAQTFALLDHAMSLRSRIGSNILLYPMFTKAYDTSAYKTKTKMPGESIVCFVITSIYKVLQMERTALVICMNQRYMAV